MKSEHKFLSLETVYVLFLTVFLFSSSACADSQESATDSKDVINSNSKSEKAGNLKMSHQILIDSLANIDPKLFSSSEALKEAVYMELPMSNEEGIALRLLTPIDIEESQDASVVVLIGVSTERNSRTPLAENARILWTNKESNKTSEVLLFQEASHKIPMPENQMPPPPVNAVESVHAYSVEVFNIREKLKVEWVPSKYTIQVVVGEMASNAVDFELVAHGVH